MAYLYKAFLYDIILAGLLCISTYWLKDLVKIYVKSNIASAIISVILLLLLLIIPLYFIIYRGTNAILNLDWKHLELLFTNLKVLLLDLSAKIPFLEMDSMISQISVSQIVSQIANIGTFIGKNSISIAIDGFFVVLFLFVFFVYGEQFYKSFKRILPFKEEQVKLIALDVSGVLRIVFFSTLLNVVLQGFAFGVAAAYFGMDGVLLGVIYGLCSMIPIIGGIIVWLPVSAVLYASGDLFGAIFIAVYSLVFIAFVIDSLVKPFLIGIVNRKILQKPLKINEFIIFFAIFAGLGSFGFWGIVIGPAITALFIVLLRIYERDFLRI